MEATEGLDKSLEDINRSAGRASGSLVTFTNRLGLVEKSLRGIVDTSFRAIEGVLEYNDAARLSIRGTSLMSSSIMGMRDSINSLTTLGPKVASAMSYSSKEATQFSASLISDMERVSGSLDIGEASKQIDEYAQNVRGSATMLNMGAADMIALQHQMVGQAHLNTSEMQNLMTEMASYATSLGLEGKDVQEMTAKHMETVMALDKDSRKSYIFDLAYIAGVQKRAAIDFGKYATSLNQKQGSEALQEELKLSALSGIDVSEISWALNQAATNPEAALKQQEIIEKSLQSFGVSLNEYKDLFAQRREGKMDSGEYEKFRIIEAQAKTVTDMTGKSLSDLLGLRNALQEVNIPSKDEAAKAIPELEGKDNQKAIQDRLVSTEETVARFTANIANVTVEAANASGALGKVADSLRDISAASKSSKDGLGIDTGVITNFIVSGASLLIAKKVGTSMMSAGSGMLSRALPSIFGAGAAAAAPASVATGAATVAAPATVAATGAAVAPAGATVAGAGAGAAGLGAAPVAATVGAGALLGYGIAQGIQKVSEVTTGKKVSEHAGDWWTSDLQKRLDDENERGKMLHEVGAGAFRDKMGPESNVERERAIEIWTKEHERAKLSGEEVAAKVAASSIRNLDKQIKDEEDRAKEVLSGLKRSFQQIWEDSSVKETKKTTLTKETPFQPGVDKPQPGKDPAEGFEKALGSIKLTGIERHLGSNRKVIENIVPLLSDMRDSLAHSASSLVSAV
jgi:hypothetical protein